MSKHYNVTKTLYKVSDFLSFKKAGNLVLSPYFQRRSVWSKGTKSYLLDTIIKGLPIPIIFLREQKSDIVKFEPKREVVDGQQRLRTIISYIAPNLLEDFVLTRDEFVISKAHNKELSNKKFEDLDNEIKQHILDYEFSVHVFPAGVDDREILQIFTRMNSTSYELNRQELRNAKYFGELKTSMYQISTEQLFRWRKWRIFNEDEIARMREVELTSEFANMMLYGITTKRRKTLDKLYEEKDGSYSERKEVENRFREIMESIEDNIGDRIVRTPYNSKTYFYPFFCAIYDLKYGVGSSLRKSKPSIIKKESLQKILNAAQMIEDKTAAKKILEITGRRTTDGKTRQVLMNYILTGGKIITEKTKTKR